MSVQSYIKENVDAFGKGVFVAPDIPEKKLNNAITSFKEEIDPNHVIALFDSSIIGNGKDGCLFLGEAFYLKAPLGKTKKFLYEEVQDIVLEKSTNEKGKEIKRVYLYLNHNDDKIDITPSLFMVPLAPFTNLVKGIMNKKENEDIEFKNTTQITPLAELSEFVKVNYVKLVTNFLFYDEGEIDVTQYMEVMSLMTRIEIEKQSRLEVRNYLNKMEPSKENIEFLTNLKGHLSEGEYEVVGNSALKDALYLLKLKHPIADWKEHTYIRELMEHFKIKDEEVEVLVEAILNDEDILKNRKTDSEIKKSMTDLATKAGAVGLPVAALYFSGSVIGLGATGITSGLAALGMGGLFGLSSMATGIGAIIIIGIGTYQGLKKVTGVNEVTNSKQREFMLQSIIRNTQKTLNHLIEDINDTTSILVEEMNKSNKNAEKIEKLSAMLKLFSEGAKVNSSQYERSQKEEIITRLPRILNLPRLKELTKQPTQLSLQEFVISSYEEKVLDTKSQSDNEEGNSKSGWVLKETLTLAELENLEQIFESIGYHQLSNAAMASTKEAAKKATQLFRR